ncbi:conserved hypothetical protein, secreted, partial [Candidatus Magnetomorum sp. HK-1]
MKKMFLSSVSFFWVITMITSYSFADCSKIVIDNFENYKENAALNNQQGWKSGSCGIVVSNADSSWRGKILRANS